MIMNGSLEIQVELGIGPRLVLMGAIIGSILVGVLTFFITDNITWGNSERNSMAMIGDGKDEVLPSLEPTALDQISSDRRQCYVSDDYPESILQWCGEISRYSEAYGLPPNLVAAVMLQESGGNPDAYSPSGAVGLMQIMPRDGIASTYMCINGPCFTSRPTIVELEDPDFNIEFGTRMLARLYEHYGDIREALKFYGPMDMGYAYADKVLTIFNGRE